jgi:hypothetical protein
MMYFWKDKHPSLCVLRINPKVMDDADEVFVTDGNAASECTCFWQATQGLEQVNANLVFAEFWTHADEKVEQERKRIKCAEVLVSDIVTPRFILGAYVSCKQGKDTLAVQAPTLPVEINPHLFFLDGVCA